MPNIDNFEQFEHLGDLVARVWPAMIGRVGEKKEGIPSINLATLIHTS